MEKGEEVEEEEAADLLDLGDESIARWRPWRIKKERSGEAER
jgi:hypothetical protein